MHRRSRRSRQCAEHRPQSSESRAGAYAATRKRFPHSGMQLAAAFVLPISAEVTWHPFKSTARRSASTETRRRRCFGICATSSACWARNSAAAWRCAAPAPCTSTARRGGRALRPSRRPKANNTTVRACSCERSFPPQLSALADPAPGVPLQPLLRDGILFQVGIEEGRGYSLGEADAYCSVGRRGYVAARASAADAGIVVVSPSGAGRSVAAAPSFASGTTLARALTVASSRGCFFGGFLYCAKQRAGKNRMRRVCEPQQVGVVRRHIFEWGLAHGW